MSARVTIFAPLDRRGFVCVLEIENISGAEIKTRAGWKGCWESSTHTACLSRSMSGVKYANIGSRRDASPIMELRGNIVPVFATAMATQARVPTRVWDADSGKEITGRSQEGILAPADSPVCYELADDYVLSPGEKKALPVYFGIGLEEVSAEASANELSLHGWERLLDHLEVWLDKHTIDCDDSFAKQLMNTNSFYNYFFSQAITLDTEELVVTCARSSRNRLCAAYRDRDAMRWTLPAVLQISWEQARKLLMYAFTEQLLNVGVAARFIDGVVLEPGIALDQISAPIRAINTYVQLTGDDSILFDRRVQTGVNTVQQILATQRHPELALFETLLRPLDELSALPYVCFSNVLVWRALLDIKSLYERIRDVDRSDEASTLASQVRSAILGNFIVPGPFGKMFAREIDLNGNFELGDDPAGSLESAHISRLLHG